MAGLLREQALQAIAPMRLALVTFTLSITLSLLVEAEPIPPNNSSFRGWSALSSYQTNAMPVSNFTRIEIACDSDKLYPTHPSMIAKDYHVFLTGSYDHFKLTANDEACKIPAPKGSKKNAEGKLGCLASYKIHYALISDIFVDKCGNLYRGFEEQMFFPELNRMQDLWSLGRCTFPDPNSELNNGNSKIVEAIAGHTYAVARSQFVFLTQLFPGDLEKIQRARTSALETHIFNPATLLFQ